MFFFTSAILLYAVRDVSAKPGNHLKLPTDLLFHLSDLLFHLFKKVTSC